MKNLSNLLLESIGYPLILLKSHNFALSGGLGVAAPTADDVSVDFTDGTQLLHIANRSVHVQPFLAALYTPNSKCFAHGFLQTDFAANGSPVSVNTGSGLAAAGTFTDPNFLFAVVGLGYWLYQSKATSGLTCVVPTVEVHHTNSLAGPDTVSAGPIQVGNFRGAVSQTSLVARTTVEFGTRSQLTAGYAIQEIDADVWILTEAHPHLSPGADYHLTASSLPTAELPKGHHWVTLWARSTTKQVLTTSDEEFAACALIAFPNNVKLLVYGTVLPWGGRGWKTHPANDGVALLAALETQASDVAKFKAQHSGAIVCYAGHFNQSLNEKHYYGSHKGKAAIVDALRGLELTCHTAGDDDAVAKITNAAHATIDHICTTARKVAARGCWPQSHEQLAGLSDHFGSWVTIDP